MAKKNNTKSAVRRMHIRKGDVVKAIAGDDKGKQGKVLGTFPAKNRALVEGLGFVKKHLRKTQDNPNGGVVEREAPIAASNLVLVSRPGQKEKE